MATPETTFKTKFRYQLAKRGFWIYIPQDAQLRGVPDTFISRNSILLAVELKIAPKHPTPLQIVQLNKLVKAGSMAAVGTWNVKNDTYTFTDWATKEDYVFPTVLGFSEFVVDLINNFV